MSEWENRRGSAGHRRTPDEDGYVEGEDRADRRSAFDERPDAAVGLRPAQQDSLLSAVIHRRIRLDVYA